MKKCLPLLALGLVLIACGSKVSQIDIGLDLGATPKAEEFADYPAVILYDFGETVINDNYSVDFKYKTLMKVFKKDQADEYFNGQVGFSDDMKLYDLRAYTITPEGKTIEIQKERMFERSSSGASFILASDAKAIIFTYPGLVDGCYIGYSFRMHSEGGGLGDGWSFQDAIPILHSKYTYTCPTTWEVRYKTYNLDIQPTIEKWAGDKRVTYTWEVHNMPAMEFEPLMPPANEHVAALSFMTTRAFGQDLFHKDWNDYAKWYIKLTKEEVVADSVLTELAKEITKDAKTDEEKLKTIYYWMHENIRYVAIEIGIGGIEPHSARSIYDNRYGDCKDMATLFKCLAKVAGIDNVFYVLIGIRGSYTFDETLIASQFNHAIAYCKLGDKEYWIDPTHSFATWGHYPYGDQGTKVLVCDDINNKALIKEIPFEPADKNLTQRFTEATLDESGNISGKSMTVTYGDAAEGLRTGIASLTNKELKDELIYSMGAMFPGAKIKNITMSNPYAFDEPCTLSYEFDGAHYAQKKDNKLIFIPNITQRIGSSAFAKEERQHDIFLMGFSSNRDSVVINIPEGYVVELTFDEYNQVKSFAKYHRICTSEEGKIIYTRQYDSLAGRIAANKYEEVKRFYENVAKLEGEAVIISR